ncbi:hypothetical protein DFH09DRAFT_1106198 [Mycena vulgaris]|nr:hypothetical protein DFH09DRAFT_1106198 [Mycena vulgaris]
MTRPGFEPGFEPGSPPLHQFFVDNNRGRGSSRYRVSRSWERGEFKGVREMEGAQWSLGQTRYRKLTLQCGGWESEGMESEKERVSLRSIAYGWEVQDIDSCADVPAMLGWTFETPGQLFVTRDGGMGTERTNGSRTKQKRGYAQKPLALRFTRWTRLRNCGEGRVRRWNTSKRNGAKAVDV